MMSRSARTLIASALLLTAASLLAAARPEPAVDLVRLQLFIQTTAGSCRVSLQTGRVGAVVTRAPSGIRVTQTGNTWQVTGGQPGQQVEVEIRTIVAGITGRTPVRWQLTQERAGTTSLEVVNINREEAPRLVDRFELQAPAAGFSSPGAEVRRGGGFSVGAVAPRLVLAHYYPWYERNTWDSPFMLGRPATRYSSDDVEDVARQMVQAKAAGLDGLIVSWEGADTDDGWNDRRMRLVLQEAARQGLKVSALIETTVANLPRLQSGVPTDPAIVERWLGQVLDLAQGSPAFLRHDGRPVVFAYSANRLRPEQWLEVRARLRDRGRDVLLIGDNTQSPLLDAFDGQFDYASNRFTVPELFDFDLRQGLRIRTHHLLGGSRGPRRIWAATVSPGYDDTRLPGRNFARVTERKGGAYYESQWYAAVASAADWVLVNSWNEWWENTSIEPGEEFGDLYVRRTRSWSDRFRAAR